MKTWAVQQIKTIQIKLQLNWIHHNGSDRSDQGRPISNRFPIKGHAWSNTFLLLRADIRDQTSFNTDHIRDLGFTQ